MLKFQQDFQMQQLKFHEKKLGILEKINKFDFDFCCSYQFFARKFFFFYEESI